MAVMTRSVTIEAPVEEVYAFASDPGRLWACMPDVATRDDQLKPGVVGSKAQIFTHGLGLHMQGTIEYTEAVPNERIVAQIHFIGEKPVWVFTFEAVEGGTAFSMTGEWHVNVPGIGKPVEGMMAKSHEGFVEAGLACVKEHLEAKVAA